MTPEEIETAKRIVDYGTSLLRTVEVKHRANPGEIFGELLSRLIESQYTVAALKAELDGDQQSTQLGELIDAIWPDGFPTGICHEVTLERIALLHRVGAAGADAAHLPEILHFVGDPDAGTETEQGDSPGTERPEDGNVELGSNARTAD